MTLQEMEREQMVKRIRRHLREVRREMLFDALNGDKMDVFIYYYSRMMARDVHTPAWQILLGFCHLYRRSQKWQQHYTHYEPPRRAKGSFYSEKRTQDAVDALSYTMAALENAAARASLDILSRDFPKPRTPGRIVLPPKGTEWRNFLEGSST